MTEPLDPELARFRALADAYGGVVARWPEAECAAAHRLAATAAGAAVLAEADRLGADVDAWRIAAPSAALAAWMMAGAAAGTAAVAPVRMPANLAAEEGTSFGEVAGPEDEW